MTKPLCSRCLLAAAVAGGLCPACDRYRRRTGRDRPVETIQAHAQRIVDKAVEERRRKVERAVLSQARQWDPNI